MTQDIQYGIAIIGCGTVGSAAAALLVEDHEALAEKTGLTVLLKYIVDVDFTTAENLGLPAELFEKDLNTVLQDDDVKIIAELVGGTTIAKEITERCLRAKKHVVTANKALLAHFGPELFSLARENGVTLAFEASCGGGIPIVRALYDGLTANRLDALYGIVNGTCNFILTEMIQKGVSYSEALADAQRTGLAEADPALDVSGMDSAHKLTILASLAFQKQIALEDIPVEGIDSLELSDVVFGQELGYIVKLLAVAQRSDKGISLRVRPAFIGTDHPLAWISGPFNAVSVYGHAVGHTMYYGRGAGGRPTASAVVSDILSIALGTAAAAFQSLKIWPDQTERTALLPTDEIRSRYYIRLMVLDAPGVFASIAEILKEQRISLSSVLQKEPSTPPGGPAAGGPAIVPVVITTHTAREGNVRKALEALDALDAVVEKGVCISILDEHEESI